MERGRKVLCLLLFSTVCALVLLFLNAFTEAESDILYAEWQEAALLSADGRETAFNPLGEPPAMGEGECYRFTTVLPERREERWLVFETTGMELSVCVDGRELFRSASPSPQRLLVRGRFGCLCPPAAGRNWLWTCGPSGRGRGSSRPCSA